MFDKFLNFSKYSGGASSTVSRPVEITDVWHGPIIILSDESQMELEKHYLNYHSTIPAESFEAIFRGQNLEGE